MPVASQGAPGAAQVLGPLLPPWMAQELALTGWVTGKDAYFEGWLNLSSATVFYGWTAVNDQKEIVLIIRGTEDAAEWAIDAQAILEPTEYAEGLIESGFYSLARTFRFRDLSGDERPIEDALGPQVMVSGHSLGAAVATILSLEFAELLGGAKVRGRFIASPRVGDERFAQYFASRVADGVPYAYAPDLVPKVPAGFGYTPLKSLVTLPANARIRDDPLDNHHCGNYAWLLDPATALALPGAVHLVS